MCGTRWIHMASILNIQTIHSQILSSNFRHDISLYLQECFLRSVSQSGAFAVDHNLQTLNSSSTQITCKSLPHPPPIILAKTATAKLFLIHHLATSFLLPNPPSADLLSTVQYLTTMPFSVPLMSTSYLSTWWWFRCDIFQTPTKSLFADSNHPGPKKAHLS